MLVKLIEASVNQVYKDERKPKLSILMLYSVFVGEKCL